jgi:pimeloyl-ACP methyl ester carboxylesterase
VSQLSRPRLRSLVGLTVALTTMATGLSTTVVAAPAVPDAGTANSQPASPPPLAMGTNGAAVPTLAWGECPDEGFGAEPGFDCATATVPLDYTDPDGPTIDLALKRRPADDQDNRIGSLFLNPGGPGGSGVNFVSVAPFAYTPEVLARFDVIGFDPRGVARSAPLVCFDTFDEFFETFAFLPPFPVNRAEERQVAQGYASYTDRCAKDADPVLAHMSTGNVARDLDLLRAAVGDEKLSYAGYSYGTQVGSTYANLFPANVRVLVLDAVLDPIAWTTGESPAQAQREPASTREHSDRGSYAALQQFFALCASAGPERCALAASGDPRATYDRLARQLRYQPVDVPLGFGLYQRVGYADLVAGTLGALYDPTSWPLLAEAVVQLVDLRNPYRAGATWQQLEQRLGLEDEPEEPEETMFQTNEGFDGVTCLDGDNPDRASDWARAGAAADRSAPYFGRLWTWISIACATWPADDPGRYAGPWNAETANPVLVVGTRYDPATRYENAQRLADLLPSSRLLTLDGYGHAALAQSQCIDAAVGAYLVAGQLPEEGTVCTPDLAPFEVVPELRAAGEDGRQAVRRELIDNLPGW